MKSVESFCMKAIKMGIEWAKIIDPGSIVTAEWVRMKCQYRRLRKGEKRGQRTKTFNEAVVRLEIEMFLDGYYKAWSIGYGPCDRCKECNLSGPCKHGLEVRPLMEA
jgi:predicted metal-binding protein